MLQVSDSLSESAYKEMCKNGTDNVNRNLCDSCVTKGCIFQSGIVRKHCDFYRTKNMIDMEQNYEPVEDKSGYVWFNKRKFQIISIETFAKSLEDGWTKGLYNLPLVESEGEE